MKRQRTWRECPTCGRGHRSCEFMTCYTCRKAGKPAQRIGEPPPPEPAIAAPAPKQSPWPVVPE